MIFQRSFLKNWKLSPLFCMARFSVERGLLMNKGPIHMHKIYTCKYFAICNKYTHISKSTFTLCSYDNNKSTFTLCSHDNNVRIGILLGTHLVTGQLYSDSRQRQQLPHYLCTGLVLGDDSLIMQTRHLCFLIHIRLKGEDSTVELV